MKIKEIDTRFQLYQELPKGGVGAEIGVCRGLNAMQLYHVAKPSKLYLCDAWMEKVPDGKGTSWTRIEDSSLWYGDHEELVTSLFKQEIEEGKVETRRQFGGDFLYSLEDNSLDWVYLDADHNYSAVDIEISLSLRKVKSNGFIMGHDYVVGPITWGCGVIRAVNERINSGELRMEALTLEVYSSFLCRVVK